VERARVRPRVVSPGSGNAVLLEDEIGALVQKGEHGLVQIAGGPGSGKSTALRHLAAILPPWMRGRVQLLDDSDLAVDTADPSLMISTSLQVSQPKPLAIYRLARWEQDDLIEYLLAAHRERCPSVMRRLRQSADCTFLQGIPELCGVVLDLMAANESLTDVRSALRYELATQLHDHRLRENVGELCLTAIRQIPNVLSHTSAKKALAESLPELPFDTDLFHLIRHQPVMLLIAADWLADLAERGRAHHVFAQQLPRELIHEAALQVSGNSQAVQHLRDWIAESHPRAFHPMVASLLHAATPGWRPEPSSRPQLAGAYLDGVKWCGVKLWGIDLQSADLEAADLLGASLQRADARRTCFCRADFRGACLTGLRAQGANFSGANLQCVTAGHADFTQANLTGAALIEADLSNADFRRAYIAGADFSGANLANSCLTGLDLKMARFEGARFGAADLRFCNFEEMRLTAPDFHDAWLLNALLTGSQLPGANFSGADLRNTGLAEVDWPDANLRHADLRGASFHLGSCRNGLVSSPIACEGSRTGFYTDDYNDQNVKPAEEIRKANLCGSDLRGARIQDVDFYLVDLRGAQYTADQAEHLRCCRAILEDRVGD
jgi:uncharacterized protein YjbI with pentapeptide repeats/energy-coupling factor transporter ATP-binding protein EcfA2